MATIENQYGRHMVQHVLFPVNIHFHWNLFIFEFLTIFEIFYIGGHFEMAVILKILITKSTTLSDNLFCVKFQKDPLYGLNLTLFCTFVTMITVTILNFFQPPKSCHILRWIFLQGFMKFDEKNPNFFLIPPFLFLWQLRQSLSNRFRFFGLISFH
jgi:hypothetical protein